MIRRCSARRLLLILMAAVLVGPGSAFAQKVESDEEKALYYLGTAVGRNLKMFDLSSEELDIVIKGLRDINTGAEMTLDDQVYAPKLQALQQERQARAAQKEREASAEYLAEQQKAKGAVTKESGLVITIIEEGKGESPEASDTVKVHYHGTLRDGTVFDSSVQRGTPAEFPLNRVIPCWTEGVQEMKVGGKAKLICPPEIAYGDRGAPPTIPGGAVLTFEVELIEIGGDGAGAEAP